MRGEIKHGETAPANETDGINGNSDKATVIMRGGMSRNNRIPEFDRKTHRMPALPEVAAISMHSKTLLFIPFSRIYAGTAQEQKGLAPKLNPSRVFAMCPSSDYSRHFGIVVNWQRVSIMATSTPSASKRWQIHD